MCHPTNTQTCSKCVTLVTHRRAVNASPQWHTFNITPLPSRVVSSFRACQQMNQTPEPLALPAECCGFLTACRQCRTFLKADHKRFPNPATCYAITILSLHSTAPQPKTAIWNSRLVSRESINTYRIWDCVTSAIDATPLYARIFERYDVRSSLLEQTLNECDNEICVSEFKKKYFM